MTDAEILKIKSIMLANHVDDETACEMAGVYARAAKDLERLAEVEAERETIHRKFIEAYSAACPGWAINTGDLDAMVRNIKQYREGKEADAKRLAAIDEVLTVQLAGLDFENKSMITLGGTEYQKWSRACFNAIGHLNERDLLPKAEVAAVKLPDIECSGCKKVIPDDDAMPCDMCGGSVCCSCTGEDGVCKRCTDKCCTACWYFKKECVCNKEEVAAYED